MLRGFMIPLLYDYDAQQPSESAWNGEMTGFTDS
jgi:hypothetical protein